MHLRLSFRDSPEENSGERRRIVAPPHPYVLEPPLEAAEIIVRVSLSFSVCFSSARPMIICPILFMRWNRWDNWESADRRMIVEPGFSFHRLRPGMTPFTTAGNYPFKGKVLPKNLLSRISPMPVVPENANHWN
jgi:hypothetical protein